MSLRVIGDVIHVKGHARLEEAETLVGLLQKGEARAIDLSDCESVHAAVVQVVLAFNYPVVGAPKDGFIRDHLAPALARNAKVEL